MSEATVAVLMQAEDKASKTIQQTKVAVEDLGGAAVKSSESMNQAGKAIENTMKKVDDMAIIADKNSKSFVKGGDAIKAAMHAADGSIGGAIGSVKGMTMAIQGMGATMATALPIATAIAAAIMALNGLITSFRDSSKEAAEAVNAENNRFKEHVDHIGEASAKYKELIGFKRELNKLQSDIDNDSPEVRAALERDVLEQEIAAVRQQMAENQQKISAANTAISYNEGVKEQNYTGHLYEQVEDDFWKNDSIGKVLKRVFVKDAYDKLFNLSEFNGSEAYNNAQAAIEEWTKTLEGLNAESEELKRAEQLAQKKLEAFDAVAKRKEEAEKRKKLLEDERKVLMEQMQAFSKMGTQLNLSSLFTANSHATNLLLDRLNGVGEDATTRDIQTNVSHISGRLDEIADALADIKVA